MLTNEVPDQSSSGAKPAPTDRRRSRRRYAAAAVIVALVAFTAATARLFVWPASGMPARVDAIVMLDGPGARLHEALALARAHRAAALVISNGSAPAGPQSSGPGYGCAPPIPGVRVICFSPDPSTTQGEAEFAGRLARTYHWHSMVLVTIAPQDSRARLRVERCFSGSVYAVTAPIRRYLWPYELAYEWAATLKALVLQRHC